MFYKYPEWRVNDNWACNDFDHREWVVSKKLNINIPQTANNDVNDANDENDENNTQEDSNE